MANMNLEQEIQQYRELGVQEYFEHPPEDTPTPWFFVNRGNPLVHLTAKPTADELTFRSFSAATGEFVCSGGASSIIDYEAKKDG